MPPTLTTQTEGEREGSSGREAGDAPEIASPTRSHPPTEIASPTRSHLPREIASPTTPEITLLDRIYAAAARAPHSHIPPRPRLAQHAATAGLA